MIFNRIHRVVKVGHAEGGLCNPSPVVGKVQFVQAQVDYRMELEIVLN